MTTIFSQLYTSPIGLMQIGATDNSLLYIEYDDSPNCQKKVQSIAKALSATIHNEPSAYHQEIITQLNEYFAGKRKEFLLQLQTNGTDFQRSVWQSLQTIPYGTTTTYKEQSLAMNNHLAIRAIASTNAKNCINIVIPCHRVVGTNGSLTGYSGGIWRKRWLLDFERQHAPSIQQQLHLL
jgi:AraC family transcriptional regulator of adaptative response/methylated-DNA-[protein]-cysteine methyltransferase